MPQIDSQLQHRLRVMWNLLRWEGELRNSRLQEVFGLKTLQATRLIRSFIETHPGALQHDQANGRWLLSVMNQEEEHAGAFDEYLANVNGSGVTPPEWLFDARLDFKAPSTRDLRLVSEACRRNTGLRVQYTSLTTPEGFERTIFPQHIVRLSQRWHIRAWCGSRNDFRDFTFGRIKSISAVPDRLPNAAGEDALWNKPISLRIGPHRALPAATSKIVRVEYFGGAVSMRSTTSAALAHYVLQAAHVAVDPQSEHPPSFFLELLNLEELRPYLFKFKEAT